MKLPRPFYRLPVQFDVERLRTETEAMSSLAWAKHPNDIKGNSSIRLISAGGGENDDVDGPMLPTPHLLAAPYLRQVLSSFGVVWSRSRLLQLAPRDGVPQHADINHHWFSRVRLHIPIITHPDVRFHCGEESVHMAAGEAWIFDNWRLHRVDNPVDAHRVHLVADTSGSSSFWKLVAHAQSPGVKSQRHRFVPSNDLFPLTERARADAVMPPAEVDLLLHDLRGELAYDHESQELLARLSAYHAVLEAFRQDWRQLYSLFGASDQGLSEYAKLRDSLRVTSRTLADGFHMRTNRVAAHAVLEGRVLRALLKDRTQPISAGTPAAAPAAPARVSDQGFPAREYPPRTSAAAKIIRPIFIVAAPRSGSTLLFETLAVSHQLVTVGGEAHWLVEGLPQLRLGTNGITSNRLDERWASPETGEQMAAQIEAHCVDSVGRRCELTVAVRFLEKTPKNSLRIPFFARLFPDAQFIFLWREPRGNLASIIEAWRSGKWKTYNGLDGFDGPWSLLLPPGWENMNGHPLEEIAAFQWQTANRIIMDDLSALPRTRWTALTYEQLLKQPAAIIERLCRFAGLEFDPALKMRTSSPLPHSRFTHMPPSPDKWKSNEPAINGVLAMAEPTWQRLRTDFDV